MENHLKMEIGRSTKKLYYFFGLFCFFMGFLEIGLLFLLVVSLARGIYALYFVFHMIPLPANIGIGELFQRSNIPLMTIILLAVPLFLSFVILPLCLLGMSLMSFFEGFLFLRITQVACIDSSPEGVAYYSPGVELHSSWKNIQGVINKSYLGGLRHFDVLTLIEPARQILAGWVPFWDKKPKLEIPLSVFADWRERELGQAIKQYAPWIMENERPKIPGDVG
jgi:hypothetical protein